MQNAAAQGVAGVALPTYAICPSCCGVIPRGHQCSGNVGGPSPPPPQLPPSHLVGPRHCSVTAAAGPGPSGSPGLGRRPSPSLLMQYQAASTTTVPQSTSGGFQPAPHVHDCPPSSYGAPLEAPGPGMTAYHPGVPISSPWPADPVRIQCPVHGRSYQPLPYVPAATFHQSVCSAALEHLPHPAQYICHHHQQQQQHQSVYAIQSPQASSQPPLLPSHYSLYSTPMALPPVSSMDLNSANSVDWCHHHGHPCPVEFQHQPDCQLVSHGGPVTTSPMQRQQYDIGLGPGLVVCRTDGEVGADAGSQRLEILSSQAGVDDDDDDADASSSYPEQHMSAATAAGYSAGDMLIISLSSFFLHRLRPLDKSADVDQDNLTYGTGWPHVVPCHKFLVIIYLIYCMCFCCFVDDSNDTLQRVSVPCSSLADSDKPYSHSAVDSCPSSASGLATVSTGSHVTEISRSHTPPERDVSSNKSNIGVGSTVANVSSQCGSYALCCIVCAFTKCHVFSCLVYFE